jgi:hypothetical protein
VRGMGGLVVDKDDVKKRISGLVHPKCKAFLALGRHNHLRFSMAFTYLGPSTARTPKCQRSRFPPGCHHCHSDC